MQKITEQQPVRRTSARAKVQTQFYQSSAPSAKKKKPLDK
jgi:hypothetical protein